MSTLQLSLGQGGQYILDAVPEFTDLALCLHSTLSFHAVKRLHDGKSSVYEGKLEMGPCVPIDVVCKIVFGSDPDKLDDLNDEATFYTTKLKALQGSTVPKFYGLFAGMYTNALGRTRRMTCILLESWGAPLKRMNDCPMKLRYATWPRMARSSFTPSQRGYHGSPSTSACRRHPAQRPSPKQYPDLGGQL